MGKGDKRTRRGKIFAGSYGKTRQKPQKAAFIATEKPAAEKAPRKRTPKVVKSAPAPEPVSEPTAGTERIDTTPESQAPEATPNAVEPTQEPAPAAEESPAEPAVESTGESSAATDEAAA